jgi:hypothetical protein
MRRRLRSVLEDEKGFTYTFMTIAAFIGLLVFGALAIDVGVMMTGRSEAQRATEASAHAGAIEFMFTKNPADAVQPAAAKAAEFVGLNSIRFGGIENALGQSSWSEGVFLQPFEEGLIEVIRDSQKVRTTVTREAVPTILFSLFGLNSLPVTARAAAQVNFASTARCLKPFAVPDAWDDRNRDGRIGNQPSNDPSTGSGEYYKRWDLETAAAWPPATGYGSEFRNNPTTPFGRDLASLPPDDWERYDPQVEEDWGRRIRLRAMNPGGTPSPSMYFTWHLPEDPPSGSCPGGTGGQSKWLKNICHCNNSKIELGTPYETGTGAQIGILGHGMSDLIKQDPYATWNPLTREVENSMFTPWHNSPRVATVALFDPRQLLVEGTNYSGIQSVVFNNFASIFLLPLPAGQGANIDDVYGIFLPYAQGASGGGPLEGTLVRRLQIVE